MTAAYERLLRAAGAAAWRLEEVDAAGDAGSWPDLPAAVRTQVRAVLEGLLEIEAIAARAPWGPPPPLTDPVAAACVAAQDGDESRHVRYLGAVLANLPAEQHPAAAPRRDAFAATVDALLAETVPWGGLYGAAHLVLEGVGFLCGYAALEVVGDARLLPHLGAGLGRVVGDERWHLGLAARLLAEAGPQPRLRARLAGAARDAVAAWGELIAPEEGHAALAAHDRRMRAVDRLAPEALG